MQFYNSLAAGRPLRGGTRYFLPNEVTSANEAPSLGQRPSPTMSKTAKRIAAVGLSGACTSARTPDRHADNQATAPPQLVGRARIDSRPLFRVQIAWPDLDPASLLFRSITGGHFPDGRPEWVFFVPAFFRRFSFGRPRETRNTVTNPHADSSFFTERTHLAAAPCSGQQAPDAPSEFAERTVRGRLPRSRRTPDGASVMTSYRTVARCG